jgi:hypothetical protein
MNIKGALTRKLGPLPAWGWAVVVGGAGLGWKLLRGGGGKSEVPPVEQQLIPVSSMPIDPSGGFFNELTIQQNRVESTLAKILETIKATAAKTKTTAPPPAPPPTTTPKPAPVSAKPAGYTTSQITDAYNYAQELFRLGFAPNPGNRTTFVSGLGGDMSPYSQVRADAYSWALSQFRAGKGPNPGSYATYTTKIPTIA